MRPVPLLPALILFAPSFAADSKPLLPCTIYQPMTDAYYDLNPITVKPLVDHKKAHKDDRTESWKAKGYDLGVNFTLNFCAPVIETIEDAVDIKEGSLKNISAFYEWKGKTYSIGYVGMIQAVPVACTRIATFCFHCTDAQRYPVGLMLTKSCS